MTRNRVAVIGHYIAYGIPIVLRHSGVAARHEQAALGERAELRRFGAGAAEVRTDSPPHPVAHGVRTDVHAAWRAEPAPMCRRRNRELATA